MYGGTLFAHKTNLCFNQAAEIETDFDFLSCFVFFLNDIVLIVITFYNPPQNSKYRVSDTDLRRSISIVLFKLESLFDSSTQEKLIIMNGDVNFSHADWNTLSSSNLVVEANFFSDHKLFRAENSVRLTRKEQKPFFQKLNINKADWH